MVITKQILSFIDPMPSLNSNDWSIILPDINNFSGERRRFCLSWFWNSYSNFLFDN